MEEVTAPRARPFYRIGVAAAKSRFWPVEDEPSVAIMTDLYRRLTAEPVATALASVQEEHHRAGHPASTWVGLVFYDND